MFMHDHVLWMVLGAIIIDAIIGDPRRLWAILPHPVVIIGNFIDFFDRRWNRTKVSEKKRLISGWILCAFLVFLSLALGAVVHGLIGGQIVGIVIGSFIGSTLIAQRSLFDHVKAVADGLDHSLTEGRKAVSMIVGRNPDTLDQAGVSRAAIESCAENFSDGVTAPLFWFAFLGLPGLFMYKAINTADSMIGHRSEKYRSFGYASANFDDTLNRVPSRLTALIFALLGPLYQKSPFKIMQIAMRDAPQHKSPSAGWPESTMGALLGLSLAGPRQYGTELVDDPYMNAGDRTDASSVDIRRSLKIMVQAAIAIATLILVLALTFPF